MEFHRQAEPLCRIEHMRGLVPTEGDALAECVDGVHQLLLGCRRQDFVADVIDVGVGASLVLLGHRMGPKERGADGRALELARNAQHLELGVAIETIARLDLDHRGALR